ncbi:hypothetical protein ABID21_004989 [Pseudorhizobium tarimense]|uniref:Lipoprotein n=1 Tax=Pseudorhizobium tarimense TaxID=1079109 RepID=A0ABV2HEH3_9HYPH
MLQRAAGYCSVGTVFRFVAFVFGLSGCSPSDRKLFITAPLVSEGAAIPMAATLVVRLAPRPEKQVTVGVSGTSPICDYGAARYRYNSVDVVKIACCPYDDSRQGHWWQGVPGRGRL